MDRKEAYRKARAYVDLAKAVIPFKKAVLLGSYVSGTPEEYSDIDIGLFVDSLADGEYWDKVVYLQSLTRKVDVRIEPHLFIRGEDKSGFGEEVEKTGIVIEENR
ncbi:MAG: nucleotidyltransferase domain-containing protein [Syntrophales bacterium]|nr:nucleotidyltransferase domain-containing protein [Syntrophales bacterium]